MNDCISLVYLLKSSELTRLTIYKLNKMDKIETLEEFYKRKFDWIPDNLKNEIGHFNVFRLNLLSGDKLKPFLINGAIFIKSCWWLATAMCIMPIKLLKLKNRHYLFPIRMIPYKWEHLDNIRSGAFCIFNQHFFHQYGNLNQYSVFQPNGTHIFELSDEQVEKVARCL